MYGDKEVDEAMRMVAQAKRDFFLLAVARGDLDWKRVDEVEVTQLLSRIQERAARLRRLLDDK